MSLIVPKIATPASPASGKIQVYSDLNDLGKFKYIDENGIIRILTAVDNNRNYLINGDHALAQRQQPATPTTYSQTASRQYAADRWWLMNENASIQYQRVDTNGAWESGTQARFYGKYKKITSAGKICFGQMVESFDAEHLRGRRVRVSVKMKRTVAAALTMRLGLINFTGITPDVLLGISGGAPSGTYLTAWGANGTDPTLGANFAYLTPVAGSAVGGSISGSALSCVLSGNWVVYSAAFDVPTTCKNLAVQLWSDSQMAANDEVNIAEAMLTDGPEVPDWCPVPTDVNVDQCSRFFQKSFSIDTAPAQGAGTAGSFRPVITTAGAVLAATQQIKFAPRLRSSTYTATFYNPAAANAFLRNTTLATDATTTALSENSDTGMTPTATGQAAWVVGNLGALHWTVDADI